MGTLGIVSRLPGARLFGPARLSKATASLALWTRQVDDSR